LQLSDCHYGLVPAKKPREIAVSLLQSHAAGSGWLEQLLEEALSRAPELGPADRGLIRELTFGVVRWQATLDWLIARRTDGRPQKLLLQILLRLGLYQMFWLDRVPDHAAVNETVEIAKRQGFGQQAGFINAVLRNCGRERDGIRAQLEQLKNRAPHLGYSHPEWLCDRWAQRWGADKLAALLDWNNTPPPTFARVNTLRATPEELAAQFDQEKVLFTPRAFDWIPGDLAFELREHPPIPTLPSFQSGHFYIQDPSTLLAVSLLDPQPGERILDLCAAPGGKTTFAAQQMRNEGAIVAQDSDPTRLQLVTENCTRLGVTCVVVGTGDPDPHPQPLSHLMGEGGRRGRVRVSPPGLMAENDFDRVLVDAPCSNTGVMRRRVELRWRIQAAELERLRVLQLELLSRAASLLKPGGTLVYSTCSLEPEENEGVVKEFLSRTAGFQLENERQLLPFVDKVDGAFVARMRKT
jgi:16S rRNA (cytosine967-C5)-methyltransferase